MAAFDCKCILWDLDDTLYSRRQAVRHLLPGLFRACLYTGRSEAFLSDAADFLMTRITGGRMMSREAFSALLEKYPPDKPYNHEDCVAYYYAHIRDFAVPSDETVQILRKLKAQGIKMAIVSNKLDPAVKELSREHFGDYIHTAIGEMPGVERKPAPGMVDMALDVLGVKKGLAVYVGDSDVDIQTAKNAGLDCVCVTWGFRDEEFLRACGGNVFVHKPQELLECIEKK
jgi:HAD superfamily hydrolase (TIGR01662 family)